MQLRKERKKAIVLYKLNSRQELRTRKKHQYENKKKNYKGNEGMQKHYR